MNLETYIPREEEWRHEFTSGKSNFVDLNQSGKGFNESSGIKLVSPSAQEIQMAKSDIKHSPYIVRSGRKRSRTGSKKKRNPKKSVKRIKRKKKRTNNSKISRSRSRKRKAKKRTY